MTALNIGPSVLLPRAVRPPVADVGMTRIRTRLAKASSAGKASIFSLLLNLGGLKKYNCKLFFCRLPLRSCGRRRSQAKKDFLERENCSACKNFHECANLGPCPHGLLAAARPRIPEFSARRRPTAPSAVLKAVYDGFDGSTRPHRSAIAASRPSASFLLPAFRFILPAPWVREESS